MKKYIYMSFFFLGFFNIFILNKFGICRNQKTKTKNIRISRTSNTSPF